MLDCSYCDKKAVLVSGYNYCGDHLGLYESRFFERAVARMFESAHHVQEFFMWAFGTITPKISDLIRWHSRIPRGVWSDEDMCYDIKQDDYMRQVVKEYKGAMKCKHVAIVTNTNGARECPGCHTIWAEDTSTMRKVYEYQPYVIWR
jgi:hypothetical protein